MKTTLLTLSKITYVPENLKEISSESRHMVRSMKIEISFPHLSKQIND